MIKTFLDTDVAFDLIARRTPYVTHMIPLLEEVKNGSISFYISDLSIPVYIYLATESYKIVDAISRISLFIESCEIITPNRNMIRQALASPFSDKEDALQYYTALHHDMDFFITRNTRDYKVTEPVLPVFDPKGFMEYLSME